MLGHEYSGQVVEVGRKVTSVAVGDRVTVDRTSIVANAGRAELARSSSVRTSWLSGQLQRRVCGYSGTGESGLQAGTVH